MDLPGEVGAAACKEAGWEWEKIDRGQGVTLVGRLWCLPKWLLGVRKPRSGPVHMRGSAIAAEARENVTLQVFQGRRSAVGFRSAANFPSKRGNSCLLCGEVKSELLPLQGSDHICI